MNEANKFFIKVSSIPDTQNLISSPISQPKISQEDIQAFPEINTFIEDLIKSLQEKEKALLSKNSEIETMKTLLTMYRNEENPLEISTKVKEITRNLENEKKSLQESFQKALHEKNTEISILKKENENLYQEKVSLVHLNEKIQQEFLKMQIELFSTMEKLQSTQSETENIQSLLQETQAENEITKAKLIEYEHISQQIKEFHSQTQKIRKESQEILELNRISLKSLEETYRSPKLKKGLIDDLGLEEEMKLLEKISHKLEGVSKDLDQMELSKKIKENVHRAHTPTSRSHMMINQSPFNKSKTLSNFSDSERNFHRGHKKVLSEVDCRQIKKLEENNSEGKLDYQIQKIQILTPIEEMINSSIKENQLKAKDGTKKEEEKDETESLENKKRGYSKSKTLFELSEEKHSEKDHGDEEKEKAHSCDSENSPYKEEDNSHNIKEEIHETLNLLEENLGDLWEDFDDQSLCNQTKKQFKNLQNLLEKLFENIEKIIHEKIVKELEFSHKLTKLSSDLKKLSAEKMRFQKNLNEILSLFETEKETEEKVSNESLLLRLRKVIEKSMYDNQLMSSQNLEINDVVREKTDLERENAKLKKENQTLISKITVQHKKIENISKERDQYYSGYLKCKQKGLLTNADTNNSNDANISRELNLEELDTILNEIEEEKQLFLKETLEPNTFKEIFGKYDTFEDLLKNFDKTKSNLNKIFSQINDICQE